MNCPDCKKEVDRFIETEPYCEDCGSHSGYQCPECHTEWDHVWNDQIYELIYSYMENQDESGG